MWFRPPSRLPGLLLALLSMAAWAVEAETSASPSLRFRRVPLTGKTEEVRVAPRIPITLTFDVELDSQAMKKHAPAGVTLLGISEHSITLMAEGDLGEGVELRVPLLAAPTLPNPTFKLVTATDVADGQVLVFRGPQAPELAQARLEECETRCAACEVALAALRGKATSPAEWILSQQVTAKGVRYTRLGKLRGTGTEGLTAGLVERFRAEAWVVLTVEVRNNYGRPWRPGTTWLESASTGRRVAARSVAMEPEVLLPYSTGRVAVEFEWPLAKPNVPGEGFRWEVEEADGTRSMSIPDVVMEDAGPIQQKGTP